MTDPKPLGLVELPETKLADAWAVDFDDRYYREEEKIKIMSRPLPSGKDRKQNPAGPFALEEDSTDFHF